MSRLLLYLIALLTLAAPARADDISAAGRGVVRVVVIAFEDGEVSDFGHGSGFAVAPNRVVTNAHVVALAAEDKEVQVGVVPSEGAQAFRARVIAVDPARDLALVELQEGSLSPIPLYVGPLEDGSPVAALGYPGNVDLATAQSAEDYITPLPPTRSVGIFSNVRPINGITTLLHTANIARGHSGGPLLDPCGRVLGVNTLITRNESGDAPFAFAVANRELAAFLRQARQTFQGVSTECVGMAERLREDRDRLAAEERARQAETAVREQQAREAALAALEERREARLALAVLLLVLSLLGFGGAGIMLVRNRERPAMILGGVGIALLIGAVIAFVSRPSRSDIAQEQAAVTSARAGASPARFAGRNICRLVPERSRVTVSSADPVPLEWSETGCVNRRTQYARNGDVWTRVLVPEGEQAVSLLEVRPASGEYVVTRYLLDAQAMTRVRELRRDIEAKACNADPEERTILADQQRDIAQLLPRLPNERLVYRCQNQGAPQSPRAR
jgi:hypothetical protein